MHLRSAVVISLIATFWSALALGCSCSNSTPIQRTSDRYRERAVFTARVIQLMGRTNSWNGTRYSRQALAVVHERYWGIPWFWPKVVLLDGGFFCNIAMADGEEYLVSGRPQRYGVVDVSVCSRTQPLKTAQLDLRTIDGSNCAVPGGTIIGHLLEWSEAQRKSLPAPNASVTFHDEKGNAYAAQSDDHAIYELQHLPPGSYAIESRLGQNQYASSNAVSVVAGLCSEMPVHLKDYGLSGRLPPGIGHYVTMKLVGSDRQSTEIPSDSIEPDGMFYFGNVPDGEYLLLLTTWQKVQGDFYYPGTFDRQKAARLKVSNHVLGHSLDFNPDLLPLVPIPVALDPPSDSGRFTWRVQLLNSNYIISEESWTAGEQFVRPYGVRGASYQIGLYGYSNRPTQYGDCRSELTPVTAKSELGVMRIEVPAGCR